MPNVLIVHLQRLIFDLEAMQNVKINSRFEFPHDLNLEPYSTQGQEWRQRKQDLEKRIEELNDEKPGTEDKAEQATDPLNIKDQEIDPQEELVLLKNELKKFNDIKTDGYEYKLCGVIVHYGTADFGHYYSYINTNRGSKEDLLDSSKDQWLEYNDSMVRKFNPQDIDNNCFGGEAQSNDNNGWIFSAKSEKTLNAYILVYDKKQKTDLELVYKNQEEKLELIKKKSMTEEDQNQQQVSDMQIEREQQLEQEPEKPKEKIVKIDYYSLDKFIPAYIHQEIWEDNHRFMFEKHIYSDKFFDFIISLANMANIYVLNDQEILCPDHQEKSKKQKTVYKFLIDMLTQFVIKVVARAFDNDKIRDFTIQIVNLLGMLPEYAFEYLKDTFFDNLGNTWEFVIECKDADVRSAICKILLQGINVVIEYHQLPLNPQELNKLDIEEIQKDEKLNIEYELINFLDMFYDEIPQLVTKNWTRFNEYFEFWRDFGKAGKNQVHYLFSKDTIAYFGDFFLQKYSPINLCGQRRQIGFNYNQASYAPLIQLISYLSLQVDLNSENQVPQEGEQTYPLTQNSKAILTSINFYQKILEEKHSPRSLNQILKLMCRGNESFSRQVSIFLLKGINSSYSEEVQPYLNSLEGFMMLNDNLVLKRIEWIFGYPQPTVSKNVDGIDHYGSFYQSSLNDNHISFQTTTYRRGANGVMNMLLEYRRKFQTFCMRILNCVVSIMIYQPVFFNYVINLPAPTYALSNFYEWFGPFIENFLSEAENYGYQQQQFKKTIGNETKHKFLKFREMIEHQHPSQQNNQEETKIEVNVQQQQEEQQQDINDNSNFDPFSNSQFDPFKKKVSDPKMGRMQSEGKTFIIGRSVKQEISLDKTEGDLKLIVYDVYSHVTEGKPTGTTNEAFPDCLMNEQYFDDDDLNLNATAANFIAKRLPQQSDEQMQQQSQEGQEGMEINLFKRQAGPLTEQEQMAQNAQNANQEQDNMSDANTEDASDNENDQENVEEGEGMNAEKQEETSDQMDIDIQEQGGEGQQGQEEENPEDEQQRLQEVIESQRMDSKVLCAVRKFLIYNQSDSSYTVSLTLKPKENEKVNFILPCTTFSSSLIAGASTQILNLIKINPLEEWGNYDQVFNVIQLNQQQQQQQGNNISQYNQFKSNRQAHFSGSNLMQRRANLVQGLQQGLSRFVLNRNRGRGGDYSSITGGTK